MKILSLVIPMYNTEKYIRRCLDSCVIDELMKDIEIIIVNDGGKDNSLSIAKEYQTKYEKDIIIIDKENGGHGSTINSGLEIATGKYFRVLDSDDWFDSNNFIQFIKKLKNCNEDLIITPYYQEYVYYGGQILYDYPNFDVDKKYSFKDITVEKLNDFYFVMASSTYLTKILKQSRLKLLEKTFYVDMQFNIIPIKYVETVRFFDINLYRYFIGRPDQSVSNSSLVKNFSHHEKVLKYLIEYYFDNKKILPKNKNLYIKNIIRLMSYTHISAMCIYWNKPKESYKMIKDFEKYLKKTDKDIYEEIYSKGYASYSKKIGYINVLICPKFSMKIMNFAIKVKSKLKGGK